LREKALLSLGRRVGGLTSSARQQPQVANGQFVSFLAVFWLSRNI
jgi:hypothetical protein